jgi:MraZ protein
MLRGFHTVTIDDKGRMAIPSRYRQRLAAEADGCLVLTLNPLDRSLWIYPLNNWEQIETKLAALSEFDKRSRRTKQMMRGYACDGQLDSQGRVLIPSELRDYARLQKQVVILGQGNKFEVWDQSAWEQQRDIWLSQLDEPDNEFSDALKSLSL